MNHIISPMPTGQASNGAAYRTVCISSSPRLLLVVIVATCRIIGAARASCSPVAAPGAGVGSADRRAAGAQAGALRRREERGAGEHHRGREQLRLGEAEQDVRVAADELDEEALGAGEREVGGEQAYRRGPMPPAPQQREDEEA